jgi:DNA-directed RNA polymerase specialized sigma24 family protein
MARPFSTVGSPECRLSPAVLLERRERRTAFREAAGRTRKLVEQLPERLRILVRLHFLHRMPTDAVAALHGWTEEQVRDGLAQALALLRDKLPANVCDLLS